MKNFTKKQSRRFGHAIRGLCVAYSSDFNFKLQVWSVLFFFIFSYIVWPLSQTELLFLALAYTLMLITELQNTSLEKALDKLHPELHDDIKISKDTAAGAVLVSGLFALVVVLVITISRF